MKGFPNGIGMQTLNSPNLTPVQGGPDREDHKCVKKSEEQKEKRKKKKEEREKIRNYFNSRPF
jgi:hypothetical protein